MVLFLFHLWIKISSWKLKTFDGTVSFFFICITIENNINSFTWNDISFKRGNQFLSYFFLNTKTFLNKLFLIFNAINLFFLIFWADFKWSWEMNGVLTGWERPGQILLEFLQRRRTRRLPIITAYKICAANPEPETHNPLWNTISTSWNPSSTQNLRIRTIGLLPSFENLVNKPLSICEMSHICV